MTRRAAQGKHSLWIGDCGLSAADELAYDMMSTACLADPHNNQHIYTSMRHRKFCDISIELWIVDRVSIIACIGGP